MQLLQSIAEQQGQLATREQLTRMVWEGQRLTDDALNVALCALRKALGDSARSPKYIQTVPGKGYRLIAPLSKFEEPKAQLPERKPLLISVATAILACLIAWLVRGASAIELAPAEATLDAAQEAQYSEAIYLLGRREPAAARAAHGLFSELIQAQPEFALAHLGLAETELFYAELGAPPRKALRAAESAASNALAIRNSAAGHVILGRVHFSLHRDFEAAEREYRIALELDPEHSMAQLGLGALAMARGRPAQALAHMESYTRLDPASYPTPYRAFALVSLGRIDEAIAELSHLAQIAPEDADLRIFLAQACALSNRSEECYRAYDSYYEISGAGQSVRDGLREHYVADGARGIHRFILKRLEARLEAGRHVSPLDMAGVHAFLGQKEQAVAWIQTALETHELGLGLVACLPAGLLLRDDPRFQALLARLGLG